MAMDRRAFLLGASALGVAACAAPERDLLESYEGLDVPLQPGVAAAPGATVEAIPDSVVTAGTRPISPMQALIDSVEPADDRVGLSFVAIARPEVTSIDVAETPGGPTAWTFSNPIESGDDLRFLVEDYDGVDFYRVLLPTRPNGSFGWIRQGDINLLRHNHRIEVNLDEFRLTLFSHDQVIFETTVGVARDNAPTPLGIYYTTELLEPTTPNSVYGAFAYGLSGFSDTFVTFNGGPGQLGIHGTNDPETLGTNVSAGCIRLHNDDITRMVDEFKVSPGVPVEVT